MGNFYICIYYSFLFKVGFILCHGILNTDATALNLWKLALQSSSCLSLFRDEVFHIHKAAEDLFVNIRGYGIFSLFGVFFFLSFLDKDNEWVIFIEVLGIEKGHIMQENTACIILPVIASF